MLSDGTYSQCTYSYISASARKDVFLSNIAVIVTLYYTAVWAVVSTLMLHLTRSMALTPVEVAWVLAAYGVCTMVSEAVLVRIAVPLLGEMFCMRVGLAAFALQSAAIGASSSVASVCVAITLSMLSNLVYPSLSALVSR